MVKDILWRTLLDNLSFGHKDHPIGDFFGKLHLMSDHQHGLMLSRQVFS